MTLIYRESGIRKEREFYDHAEMMSFALSAGIEYLMSVWDERMKRGLK